MVDHMSGLPAHLMFERQVAKTPTATALVYESQQLTYQELNRRANQLAHHLQKLGVGPEVLVGVCLERSLDAVIGQLAILKAGGAYVSLDPVSPRERLAFMLEDTQAPILLTRKACIDPALAYHGHMISLEREHDLFSQESDENPLSGVNIQNLAYVIYTSGSTGWPKGVQVTHCGLTNLIDWHQRAFQVTRMDRATQVAALGFDASVWELWPYITIGASVYFPDEETRISPPQLQAWLLAHAITISFLPTPLAEHILRLSWPSATDLRILLTGGDTLRHHPSPLLRFQVVNNYGPTENSVVTTSCRLEAASEASHAPAIGLPISNTYVSVLDSQMQPVPSGEAGELYIGGASLARGYLNRPDMTAERFVPDPSGENAGARLYRSGDLVRYRSDGQLEFLGRIDSQVKIRGFRIELGEIETVLSSHPAIQEAVVLAREQEDGEKQLVAYLVPGLRSVPSLHELRAFLKERLLRYMVPAAFVWIETLPLTINGKVDRQKLPAPEQVRSQFTEDLQSARTPLEEQVVAIWREVMQIDRVGIYDNFFDLGGHSLQATQIVARVSHLCGVEISLSTFFRGPTPADLSQQIEQSGNLKTGRPALTHSVRQGDLPLSFAQERLWFLDQLAPENAFYNVPLATHLSGMLNTVALEQSLNEIVRRHDVCRVSFAPVEGTPVQRVAPNMFNVLRRIDLRTIAGVEVMTKAREFISAEARRPFDLTVGPLFRSFLLQLNDEEYILLLVMHHIITDGWSVGVLYRELAAIYTSCLAGMPAPLPALPIQYPDFVSWQRQWLQGDVLEQQLNYWRQRLHDSPAILHLPIDRPRKAMQTFRGARQAILLSPQLTKALKELSSQEEVTLFTTLLTAFNIVLWHATGQEDILLGSPVANRTQMETEQLIGFFVNTLVLRTNLKNDPSFLVLLRQVHEVALEAYAYQDVPFERVVEAVCPSRDLSYNPLFQVIFALQDIADLELPGVYSRPLTVETETALFDISVEVTETKAGLAVSAEYSTDLFDAGTIIRLLQHYETLLSGIVAHPEQCLSELSAFSDGPVKPAAPIEPRVRLRNSRMSGRRQSGTLEHFKAPRNPVEETLAGIWAEVLKLDRVGISDNFFDLGGHSLLATRVVSRIHDTFQIALPVHTIFQTADIAELAVTLAGYETSPGQVAAIARIYKQLDGMSADAIRATLQNKRKGA